MKKILLKCKDRFNGIFCVFSAIVALIFKIPSIAYYIYNENTHIAWDKPVWYNRYVIISDILLLLLFIFEFIADMSDDRENVT